MLFEFYSLSTQIFKSSDMIFCAVERLNKKRQSIDIGHGIHVRQY